MPANGYPYNSARCRESARQLPVRCSRSCSRAVVVVTRATIVIVIFVVVTRADAVGLHLRRHRGDGVNAGRSSVIVAVVWHGVGPCEKEAKLWCGIIRRAGSPRRRRGRCPRESLPVGSLARNGSHRTIHERYQNPSAMRYAEVAAAARRVCIAIPSAVSTALPRPLAPRRT